MRLWGMALLMTIACTALTACGDDDKELDINDVLTGTWVLDHYELVSDQDYDLLVDHLDFNADGTFLLKYDEYESDKGTFKADKNNIRFDYEDEKGEAGFLLWEVLSFSESTLNAKYKDTDHDFVATVWLVKRTN